MLGKLIRDYISEIGLKQSAVAAKANIPDNTFSTMLSGKRKISAEEYFAICDALGVPLGMFVQKLKQTA